MLRANPMAKLCFCCASMSAGESSGLLQADLHFCMRAMRSALRTAAVDDGSLDTDVLELWE
jgi:thymidine kinase